MTSTCSSALASLAQSRDWELVVAFGSRARQEGRPDSDFDVAILRGHGQNCSGGLESALGESHLDINWLDESSWLMWAEVARDGLPLFQARAGLFDEFGSLATTRSSIHSPGTGKDTAIELRPGGAQSGPTGRVSNSCSWRLVHRYDTLATDEFTTLLTLCVQPWRAYLSSVLTHLP